MSLVHEVLWVSFPTSEVPEEPSMERGLSPCPWWAVFVMGLVGSRQEGLALKGRRMTVGAFSCPASSLQFSGGIGALGQCHHAATSCHLQLSSISWVGMPAPLALAFCPAEK